MKEMVKKNPGVDWALVCSILFWIMIITMFITLISFGVTRIPNPVLEITESFASRGNIMIAHRNGDPVRFSNTRCLWTPDIFTLNVTKEAGSLVLVGNEIKQGRVSKLEPGEMAKLEKNINMKEGRVGRIIILDLMSGQQIFSQTVKVTE